MTQGETEMREIIGSYIKNKCIYILTMDNLNIKLKKNPIYSIIIKNKNP